MLPSHLAPVARVISQRRDVDDVRLELRAVCPCAADQFAVRFAGREGERFICPDDRSDLSVTAACAKCGATALLFDLRQHGWGPSLYPAASAYEVQTSATTWKCRACGGTGHRIGISLGWTPFDEVLQDLGGRAEVDESLWIEAFETIRIDLGCATCGLSTERWVDLEVA
jgi:hypothetical protein